MSQSAMGSNQIDIRIDAEVQCTDGPGGRVKCIVLNPVTDRITDVVVHEPGLLGGEVIVPVKQIASSTPDRIQLRLSRSELMGMESFLTTQYRLPGDGEIGTAPWSAYPYGSIYWAPYVGMGGGPYPMTYEAIPLGEVAMHRSDPIEATDGHVGRIEGFVVDQQSEGITHLLLREGHLWGTQDVTIPVSSVKDIEDGVVHLNLSKQEIAALPAVKVRR